MYKPEYQRRSILNLISSIGITLGYRSKYKPLRLLDSSDLKDAKNIVLIIIDGLGYEFLMKNGKGTIFNENIKGKMTTTFPSSTSAAIPSLMTGLSSQEHGMTGWYMYLKELGSSVIPLPFTPRLNNELKLGKLIDISKIFNIKPFVNNINAKPYLVQGNEILNSYFTIVAAGKSKRIGYNTMEGFFRAIKKIIFSNSRRKYIYAYYPEHDSLCHKYGSTNKKILNHFKKLNKKLVSFLKSIEGTNTILIITSDHGIIDVPASKRIKLDDHPKLRETLILPLCGEHRFAYCYVKPSKEKEFVKYVKTKLKHCCNLYKSEDLLRRGYFGLFEIHERFRERIGDYVLIMKDNWGIYDKLVYQKKYSYHIGDHGGLSKEELYVPLIFIKK